MNKLSFSILNTNTNKVFQYKVGDLNSIMISETNNATIAIKSFIKMITSTLLLFFLILVLFLINPTNQTIYILGIFLFVLLLLKPLGSYSKNLGALRVSYLREFSGLFSDYIINIKQLKLLSLEKNALKELYYKSSELVKIIKKIKFFSQLSRPVLETFFVIIIALFLSFYIFYSSYDASTVLPIVGLLVLIGYRSLSQVNIITVTYYQLSSFITAFNKIDSLLLNFKNPVNKKTNNLIGLKKYNGEIIFSNINFSYNKISIFDNLNLKIPAKAKVLITGKSGSGKSTLIDLLVKLQKLQSGNITINDKDIDKLDPHLLRKKISYVSQEVLLFNRSIIDNIRTARQDLTIEEFKKCADITFCSEFINNLPKKENYRVGDRGVNLSGGQRQRIGILRSIINKPDILILDETINALDKNLSINLFENLLDYLKESTIILISHSEIDRKYFDTVINLDKIKEKWIK